MNLAWDSKRLIFKRWGDCQGRYAMYDWREMEAKKKNSDLEMLV